MNQLNQIELSLVVPLFNESEVFEKLTQRLIATMDQAPFACEAILIDDGSTDGTRDHITHLCQTDPRFRGVLLSRNFGHQKAVSAGLDHARGKTVGVIDGDLQDPPELLLDFHKKLSAGYDVVYAVRKNRKENFLKRFCYFAFYRLLQKVSTVDIPLDSGDFCLMNRDVVDQIRCMPERHRFIRGMRSWVGFRQTPYEYDRSSRQAGDSKYSIAKLLKLALDGVFTFSETPLRIATCCGATVATFAMLWAVYILGWRLLGDANQLPGFATTACGMFFLGGVQLICLGILGEYIARIHSEVKRRPIYIVEKVVEFSSAERVRSEVSIENSIEQEIEQIRRNIPVMEDSIFTQTPSPSETS